MTVTLITDLYICYVVIVVVVVLQHVQQGETQMYHIVTNLFSWNADVWNASFTKRVLLMIV